MEKYLSKIDLKKMLGIHDPELIELIEKEILPIYYQNPAGGFIQIPHRIFDRKPVIVRNRTFGTYHETFHRVTRKPTREEIEAKLKKNIWFSLSDIEDAQYEGKIAGSEKQRGETTVAEAGRGGGNAPKSNRVILEAINDFLIKNPKMIDCPDSKIIRTFSKRFTSDKPCAFTLNGKPCEVYCDGGEIHSSIGDTIKKSLKINTVQRFYLPAVKKTILQKKSNIPS